MNILLQILAGDPTSVLYRILRDEKHLLYHIGHATYNADTFGTFAFVLNIAPENIQQSIDIIKAEVTKVAAGEIADDKISLAKTRIRAKEIFANQAVQDMADNDATTLLLYPDIQYPDQWIEHIDTVTKDEIVRTAHHMSQHLNILAVCAKVKGKYEF